jgi:hypothetical protein
MRLLTQSITSSILPLDLRADVRLNDRGQYRLFEVPRHPSDFVKLSSTCWPYGTEFFIEAGPWHYVAQPGGS